MIILACQIILIGFIFRSHCHRQRSCFAICTRYVHEDFPASSLKSNKAKLLSKLVLTLYIMSMTYRFVSEKEPASILFFWRSLYSPVMETSGKPLCISSSGCRVKYLEKVCHAAYSYSHCRTYTCLLIFN